MRTLFLTTVFALFIINSVLGQTATSSTSKSTSYSITFDTDDVEDNSSVSIKRNENVYKFSAKFHKNKTGRVKKLLVDQLGNKNLTVEDDTFRWTESENGKTIYNYKLTDNTLKIFVDKEFANPKIINSVEALGILLKDTISGTDSKKQVKEDAERKLREAERALARAKRELEKAKKDEKV